MFKWDKINSKDKIILRKMLWENPKIILRNYSKEKLKQVFLEYYYLFDKKNLNFWKIILNIDEDEFIRKTEKSFRSNCKIWDY